MDEHNHGAIPELQESVTQVQLDVLIACHTESVSRTTTNRYRRFDLTFKVEEKLKVLKRLSLFL